MENETTEVIPNNYLKIGEIVLSSAEMKLPEMGSLLLELLEQEAIQLYLGTIKIKREEKEMLSGSCLT